MQRVHVETLGVVDGPVNLADRDHRAAHLVRDDLRGVRAGVAEALDDVRRLGEIEARQLGRLAHHVHAAAGRVETSGPGFKTKDAYLKNVFVAVSGRRLCGVTKIKDGGEATGGKALKSLIKALAGI